MDIEKLADRLAYYNEWRRGLDGKQPHPVELGADIDEAVSALRELARLRAEVEALTKAMVEASKQMDGFIHLANHVGINDADGFYLSAALDAKKILDAAIDAARGKCNG